MQSQTALDRFKSVHDALQQDRRWWRDATRLRYAAMAAIMCEGSGTSVAHGIRKMGDDLKKEFPWYWGVNPNIQFVVGTLLLLQRDSAKRFINELIRVRKLFREQRLHRALQFELLAVLILRIKAEGRTISRGTVRQFKAIYDEMKKHHRFLTGPDDFPACALLTGQSGTPQTIGEGIEAIYDQLHDSKFSKGNPLQTAANIMYLAPGRTRDVVGRATALRNEFRSNNVRINQRDYDEVAILSMLQLPAWKVVARVLDLRDELVSVRPKINKLLRFDLAVGIAFADFAAGVAESQPLGGAKILLDVQAMLAAQAAAMAAGAAAAAAAT
jgi:hypothetical protein